MHLTAKAGWMKPKGLYKSRLPKRVKQSTRDALAEIVGVPTKPPPKLGDARQSRSKLAFERELEDRMVSFYADPVGFVRYVFPWGEPGTLLADEEGPDKWQIDVLMEIARHVEGSIDGTIESAMQAAVASGHGVGKGAETAWIILWFMSTRPHPQIVVTANTQPQLATKTWRELAKWHKLSINTHWFKWTATRFYKVSDPETWFAAAIAWSEMRPEAFAGTHEKHVLIIYDEASSIPDIIWETTSGAMTTPGAFWFVWGNPTQNTGRFKDCFDKFKHRWTTWQIDSRTAKKANKAQIEADIEDWGLDSDFVRIRVLGIFPRRSSTQFISTADVEAAIENQLPKEVYQLSPKVIGADPARFGDDKSVIAIRQGFKLLEIREYREVDTQEFASLIIATAKEYRADAVFVDEVGIGAGVVDRMNHIGWIIPIPVNGASRSSDPQYFNKRAEMWGNMRDWIPHADLLDRKTLKDQLTGIEYGFSERGAKLQLESKKNMKNRGLDSPDEGDALALTHAEPIMHTSNSREEYEDFDFDDDEHEVGRSEVTGY